LQQITPAYLRSHTRVWTVPLPDHEEANRRALLHGLDGVVVIDPFCGGPESVEPFRELLAKYGARAYIGIDQRTFDGDITGRAIGNFGIVFRLRPRPNAVPGVIVQGDALQAMRRLPNELGAVALNDIGQESMDPTEPYGRDFLDHTLRVAGKHNLIFGEEERFGPLAELYRTDSADGYVIVSPEPGQSERFYFLYSKVRQPRRR